jgi:glycosyltransferase involved in cell wall biosynthesis
MNTSVQKPRLAVVSPFLDKRHGTERRVVEWVSQLASTFDIHIYSQSIKDLDSSRFTLHRIPKLPGPHLANFLWWFAANRLWREWDRRFRGLRYDLVYSPGPNCLDADAMSVHIVFAEYRRKTESAVDQEREAVSSWPKRLHRKLYYRFAIFLEKRAYTSPDITLILIAKKTSKALEEYYGRCTPCPVVYVGLDHETFNPGRRAELRKAAREGLGLRNGRFALVLIGNDWRNKGLLVLLKAMVLLRELPIDLLVVGHDDPKGFRSTVREMSMDDRVRFLPPRSDVEFYYAAGDVYTGPSLEDTFAQPPAEAMACGLPVIVSAANGTSEIITDGVDGMILRDPTDVNALAGMIRGLFENEDFRDSLGRKAAETACQYTWERNGREFTVIFNEILRRKAGPTVRTRARESQAVRRATNVK